MAAGGAHADDYYDSDRDSYGNLGDELSLRRFASPREDTEVDLSGYLRLRGEGLYNLDLDHGITPSGDPLFPVPLGGDGQLLSTADTRLRTDLAIYPRGMGVAIKARIDVLDNLALGSTPEGRPSTSRAPTPAASPGQRPPESAMLVRQAWGEVLTPFGVLAAGRIGNAWGLGIVANAGDCEDCDGGDASDRIAFSTPIADHFVALAFDFSATGPQTRRRDNARPLDLLPSDDVRSLTLAAGRIRSPLARKRRRQAGLATWEYGGYLSHRWQDDDVPADYLPVAGPVAIDAAQVMARGYRATAASGWGRVLTPRLRVEAELAYLTASVDQPSLIPGVTLEKSASSSQLGLAVESDLEVSELVTTGVDAGYASGDSAPGFGAFPRANAPAATAGDLDGPQASFDGDSSVDNFRFHPDYRIDKILFREIIGTITDAVYFRPHARLARRLGPGQLSLSVAAILSWAAEPNSTPSGKRFLGIELDPTIRYQAVGFIANLDYAVLLPGSGFDNPTTNATPELAQLVRMRLEYLF
jgi:uncharacterized protein (TIGR04551 family)